MQYIVIYYDENNNNQKSWKHRSTLESAQEFNKQREDTCEICVSLLEYQKLEDKVKILEDRIKKIHEMTKEI